MKIIQVSKNHINMEHRDCSKDFVVYSDGYGMAVRGFFYVILFFI